MRSTFMRFTLATAFIAQAFAVEAASDNRRFYGYLDAQGAFHPEIAAPTATPVAAVTYTGAYAVTMTINIASDAAHVSRSSPVRCTLSLAVVGSIDSIVETDQVSVAISGNVATCKVVIPYSWSLQTAAGTRVFPTINVTAMDINGNGRTHTIQLPNIAVPNNGAATKVTRTIRI